MDFVIKIWVCYTISLDILTYYISPTNVLIKNVFSI